jgi:WG repeat protein
MRLIALTLIAALGFIACPVTYANEQPNLLPRCGQTAFDLCGFIDAEIWENKGRTVFVIEPKFEVAKQFSERLAAVRIEGKFGYIDLSGEIVIEPQFDQAGEFDQGLAVAGDVSAFGVINRSGGYVVEPLFAQALIFSDQTILGAPAENSERAWSSPYNYSIHDAGMYHITNGWITEQKYHFERFDTAKRDLIWAQVPGGKPGTWDDKYGLMRVDGSWLIEPQYSYAIELKNNRAPVRKIIDGKTVSGAIDGKGAEVIPFVFDYLTHWGDGFLLAGKGAYPNRKFGLVTLDGELLAGRYFDEIERPDRVFGPDHPEQNFFSVKDDGEWKTLLKDGTLLADQRVGNVFMKCDQFQIFYGVKGYDLKPKDLALPTVWFDEPLFSFTGQKCDPPPTLVRGDTYAAILENGAVFGGFFVNSRGFFGTHRWVSVDDKWGLVNASGGFAIAPVYDSIDNEKGYAADQDLPSAKADTTYKVSIDDEVYRLRFLEGTYKQEPFTEPKEDRSQTLNCKGGLKRKSKDGLWGIVDKNGDDLIPPKYRAISCFSSGLAWAPDDALRKWCPIDRYGKLRSAPACSDSYYPISMSHHGPEKFHEDPYESNVLWMRAWLDYGEGRRDQKPKFVPW